MCSVVVSRCRVPDGQREFDVGSATIWRNTKFPRIRSTRSNRAELGKRELPQLDLLDRSHGSRRSVNGCSSCVHLWDALREHWAIGQCLRLNSFPSITHHQVIRASHQSLGFIQSSGCHPERH